MISQNKAADFLGVSINVFRNAMEGDYLIPQSRTKLDGQDKPILGFEPGYLKEVDRILPPRDKKGNRGKKGRTVFTPEIIEKLKPINKKWPTE